MSANSHAPLITPARDRVQEKQDEQDERLSALGQQLAAAIAHITGLEARVRALEATANGDNK